MDTVKAFNSELTALYEGKPPISRAKMAQLTKSAIKGIKFYKHVVQSVEKFIQKCRPEYKIPGLYVIDSIVRSSRHQFGPEKDVFAPRFSKNIVQTIQHVLKCQQEEKPKVIRVLNLWQKNTVFSPAVIQPLLDLAADPENPEVFQQAVLLVQDATGLEPTLVQPKPPKSRKEKPVSVPVIDDKSSAASVSSAPAQDDDLLKAVSQLLQQTQEPQQLTLSAQESQLRQLQVLQEQLVQQSKILAKPAVPQTPLIDSGLLTQIQALTNQLLGETTEEKATPAKPAFNKKLLDFDYGESDEEETRKSPLGLNKTNISDQLQDSSDSHLKTSEEVKPELDSHRHRMMQEEYDDALDQAPPPHHRSNRYQEQQDEDREEDLEQVEFDEELRRPREPPHPPEPSGYPEDSFDGQTSHDAASRDYSRDDYSHEQEDGEYEEGEYVEEDMNNDSFSRAKEDSYHELSSYRRRQKEEYIQPERDRNDGYRREKSKKSSRKRDRAKRDAEEGGKSSRGKDREKQRDEERRRDREREVSEEGGYSHKEKKLRELPFGPSREYFEQSSKKHRKKDRSRSKSKSRTPKRKKRSRSREKKKRSRSKSKERRKRSHSKDKDKERKRREKVREKIRLENGLPPLKEGHVAVCSTTLWIGHLSRHTTEEVLRKELEACGKVVQISLVLPRGCAFVCLAKRKEAAIALTQLRGVRLLGNSLKADWAPGKGIKDSKSYSHKFDKELGVVYIPYGKLHKVSLDEISQGGMIDEESLPSHMRTVIHIDLDEEPTELVDDQTKSEVEDVVVVETEPQPPKPEEAKPALPPEPVPAPPEPAVEPSAVEVSKPLAPSDLGMLPQPVMPALPNALVTSQIPYATAAMVHHPLVGTGGVIVPGMVPPPLGIPLPALGVPGLPPAVPPVTTASGMPEMTPQDLEGKTPIKDELDDQQQMVSVSAAQQANEQDTSFAGVPVGGSSTVVKSQLSHLASDIPTDMEYDPSQPSEDNAMDDQENKASSIISAVKPHPGEEDGFLPLVRARSVKKTPKKASGNLDSAFSGTGLMNKKKGISIVIDEWKKKNLGEEKSEEQIGENSTEPKHKEETMDLSADDSYEEHLWKSEADNTSSMGQSIPTINTTAEYNQMAATSSSDQESNLENISLPPIGVNMKNVSENSSYPITTPGPIKSNPDGTSKMSSFPSTVGSAVPSSIPLPFQTSSANIPQSEPYGPPSSVPSLQNMPFPSSISAPQNSPMVQSSEADPLNIPYPPNSNIPYPPSSISTPNSMPGMPSIPLPPRSLSAAGYTNAPTPPATMPMHGTDYQGHPPPIPGKDGFLPPPPTPPTGLYKGNANQNQAPLFSSAPSNPSVNMTTPLRQGSNNNTPAPFEEDGINFGPGAQDQDLRQPIHQNQGNRPPFSSAGPPFSSSCPPFSSSGPPFSSGGPPFGTVPSSFPMMSESNVPPFPGGPNIQSGRGLELDRFQGKGSGYYDEGDNSSQSSSQFGDSGRDGLGCYRRQGFQDRGENNRGQESPKTMNRDGGNDWNDHFEQDSPEIHSNNPYEIIGDQDPQGYDGQPPLSEPNGKQGPHNFERDNTLFDEGPQNQYPMNPESDFEMRNKPPLFEQQGGGPPQFHGPRFDGPPRFEGPQAMGGPRFTGNEDPSGVVVPRFRPTRMEGPVNHGGMGSGNVRCQVPPNLGSGTLGPPGIGGPGDQGQPRMPGPGNQRPAMSGPGFRNQEQGNPGPQRMGGPVNIGPPMMGGPRNPAPPGMGGPGGNQGLRMGGPGNLGPPSFGGPGNQGPPGIGGQGNQRHTGMAGPGNQAQPHIGGPGNQGLPYRGGPNNERPLGIGGPGNQGPPGIGGPGNQGPPSMGGPLNQGPPGMGGPRNQGPTSMGGPGNQGHPGIGAPGNQGPPGMAGPGNQGAPGMAGPGNQGPPVMGGPGNQGHPGIGAPGNQGPPGMAGPGNQGAPGMAGPGNQGPPVMGGPGNQGKPGMGGPGNQGPSGIGGPGNQGPSRMGVPGNQGPPGMGGPGNQGPPGMGVPGNQGPPGMGGPGNQGLPPIRGPNNQGPPRMDGPGNNGRSNFGGPRMIGPPGLGGLRNQGPSGLGGQGSRGPPDMGGPRSQVPTGMGGPGNQAPGSRPPLDMGGPPNQGQHRFGVPSNQGPSNVGPQNQGPLRMDGPGAPNLGGPNSQIPPDMRGSRMDGPGNRPQGPPNFRDRNFNGPGPMRPFKEEGPKGRFDGPRDRFPGPVESDFQESSNSRNFVPDRIRDDGSMDRFESPENHSEPRLGEPFGGRMSERSQGPHTPGFGGSRQAGHPSGKKNQIPGLMSIGPSLMELGVDMDAAKRDSGGNRNAAPMEKAPDRDEPFVRDQPRFDERDNDNFDRRERGHFSRRNSDGFRDRSRGRSRGNDRYGKFDRKESFGQRDLNERPGFRGQSDDRNWNKDAGERSRSPKGVDEFGRVPREDTKYCGTPKGRDHSSAKKQNKNEKTVEEQDFLFNENDFDDFNIEEYDREMEAKESKKSTAEQDYDIDNWGDDNFLRDNWGDEKSASTNNPNKGKKSDHKPTKTSTPSSHAKGNIAGSESKSEAFKSATSSQGQKESVEKCEAKGSPDN